MLRFEVGKVNPTKNLSNIHGREQLESRAYRDPGKEKACVSGIEKNVSGNGVTVGSLVKIRKRESTLQYGLSKDITYKMESILSK